MNIKSFKYSGNKSQTLKISDSLQVLKVNKDF